MAAFCRSNEKKRKFSSDLKAKLETKPRNELVSDQHTTYIPYEKSRHKPNMEKVSHGPCVRNEKSSLSQKGQCLSVCDVLSSLLKVTLWCKALRSPLNVPTQTVFWPHYPIYARPPQGGTGPSNNDKFHNIALKWSSLTGQFVC